MTAADLPAIAQVDVGLLAFVFLVTLLAASLASIVHVWWTERRDARRRLPDVHRTVTEARARTAARGHWEQLHRSDAEGEAVPAVREVAR